MRSTNWALGLIAASVGLMAAPAVDGQELIDAASGAPAGGRVERRASDGATGLRSILRRSRAGADQRNAADSEAPPFQPASGNVGDGAQAASSAADDRGISSQLPAERPATYARTSSRPYLGVTFNQQYPDSAVILAVNPGSPAAQAGLRPGDAIHAVNQTRVSSWQDVVRVVGNLQPGARLEIAFSRRIEDRAQIVLAGQEFQQSGATAFEPIQPRGVEQAGFETPASSPSGASDTRVIRGATGDYEAAAAEASRRPAAQPSEATREDERNRRRLDRAPDDSRAGRGRGLFLRRRN